MNSTARTSRNWTVTLACVPLFAVALWFSIASWFVIFDGNVPFEPIVRGCISLVFIYMTYRLAVVIKRGYLEVRLRDLARDFFGGLQ